MKSTEEALRAFDETQGEPWPDLAEAPLPTFPVELLPDYCAQLVEAVAVSFPAPVDYAACAALGAASSALVGRVIVQPRGEHREPVQLFLGLVGEPGTKKSPVMKYFAAPLREWLNRENEGIRKRNKRKQKERELLNEESRKKRLSVEDRLLIQDQLEDIEDEPEVEILQGDVTTEALVKRMQKQAGRAAIFTDEGNVVNILSGVTYGRAGSAPNIDAFLQGYDGGEVNVDRATGDSVHLDRADLALTVGLQPDLLERMTTTRELISRGFTQRVLFFIPAPLRGVNVKNLPTIPHKLFNVWAEKLEELAAVHRDKPVLLPLSEEARAAYVDYWQSVEDRIDTVFGAPPSLQQWARKAHGKVARLAGILAKLENPSTSIIDARFVRNAIAVMEGYFIPHAMKAFGGGDHLGADAKALVPLIRDAEAFKEAELFHKVSGQLIYKGKSGRDRFSLALLDLCEKGYIKTVVQPAASGKGRPPSATYEVNPALRSSPTNIKPSEEGEL